jgi:hypothetical protein
MDGGIAAVLGALVGVFGSIGSAGLGYYASRTQVREQAVVQYATRLREERRESYLSFVSAAEQLELALRKFSPGNYSSVEEIPRNASGDIDWAIIGDVAREVEDAQHAMFQAVARVDLAGPAGVAEASGGAWMHVLAFRDGMANVAERREISESTLSWLKAEMEGFRDEYQKFMLEAQAVLQELVWIRTKRHRLRMIGRAGRP